MACAAVNDVLALGVPAVPARADGRRHGPGRVPVPRRRPAGRHAGPILIVQSDDAGTAAADLDAFVRVSRQLGATEALVAEDEAEAALLVEARRLVGPAHEALGAELVDDVCVPRARLADLLAGVARIGERARRPR